MNLSVGIVGLPNVGKSTLFRLLTKQEINVANYPFATIDPNVGIVAVPDERLRKLAELAKAKKITPAVVEFYDIAGLVKGAHEGEGLGNQFLAHIREVKAIVQVIRVFPSSEIIHVEGEANPLRDLEIVNTELALKDLDTVQGRIENVEGKTRTGDTAAIRELGILEKLRKVLNARDLARSSSGKLADDPAIKQLTLLTNKPQIYLLNGKEENVPLELIEEIKTLGGDYLILDLASENNLDALIRLAYEVLGLITFFTFGEDETRAWQIPRGVTVRQAAGTIHTDFEERFIKADVINWEKLLEAGDPSADSTGSPQAGSGQAWTIAKQKGWMRLEGKEYLMQDGDVMEIKHG